MLAENIFRWLTPGGDLVFSVEHPVFTAYGESGLYMMRMERFFIFPWITIIMREREERFLKPVIDIIER